MAQIDPNIALSIRPAQIESPLVHAARAAELQGAQQSQFMNMLKMKEYVDESRTKNNMMKWLSGKPDLDDDKNINYLATQFGPQGLALAKQIDDRRKAQSEADYRQAQITDLKSQGVKRNYELGESQTKNAINTISGFRNRQQAIDLLYESEANGTIPRAAAENIRRAIPENEEEFPAFKQSLIERLMSPTERLQHRKAELDDEKHKSELFQTRLKQSRYFLENINPNSPAAAQQYLSWYTANINDPILGPVLASRGVDEASVRADIEEAIRTGRLSELIMTSKLGMEKYTELTPAFNKAEREQIDQEHSDFLNTPGNPPLTRLQFIEFRKRQRGTAAAPNAAAPAPAPAAAVDAAAPAPAPAAAVDLTNVPLANRSVMFNQPQVNQPAVNQLGGFRTNVAAVNNLGGMPAVTAADRPAPATATQAAGATERPAIHPEAAKLYSSSLPSDKAKADIIQRNYENDSKQTEKQRDFAAAKDAGFKGNFPQWLDQQRETENEREYRRAKEDGSFKGSFVDWKREMAKATKIVLQTPQGPKPTDTTMDMLAAAYIEDKTSINSVPKPLRMSIMNRAAEMLGGRGLTGEQSGRALVESRVDAKTREATVREFKVGKSAVATRSFNTAIDHLETMEKLAIALQNNDTRAFNSVGNFFSKQVGAPAITNFEAAKAIVGGEVAKALTGANMALKDREEIRDSIIASSSPEQLRGVLKTYKQLLGGQLNSLNIQYQTGTGKDDFATKLSPAARRELEALNPQKPVSSAPRQMSTQDKEALDWANAHPNDSRAAAIKKRLGVK